MYIAKSRFHCIYNSAIMYVMLYPQVGGDQLYSGSYDKTVRVWELSSLVRQQQKRAGGRGGGSLRGHVF